MEAPSERKWGKFSTKNIEGQWLRCTSTTPWTSFLHLCQMLLKELIETGHKLAFMRPFTWMKERGWRKREGLHHQHRKRSITCNISSRSSGMKKHMLQRNLEKATFCAVRRRVVPNCFMKTTCYAMVKWKLDRPQAIILQFPIWSTNKGSRKKGEPLLKFEPRKTSFKRYWQSNATCGIEVHSIKLNWK